MHAITYNDDGSVTITARKWKQITSRLNWLDALEAAGVDNWQGWDEAVEIMREYSNDESD